MSDLFDDAVAKIEAAYTGQGHQLGWRFLATTRRTVAGDAEVAFLTLNPGGEEADPTNPSASCEGGSAYLCEKWPIPGKAPRRYGPGEAPLQRQVQGMFEWLGRDPNTTLSAYFIPFRSRSLNELVAPNTAWPFAVSLWRGLFRAVQPELIVCLGEDVERGLRQVFEAEGGLPRTRAPYPVGWGSQTAWVTCYRERVLLRLPHLSRFKIFDRSESVATLSDLQRVVERRWEEAKQRRAGLA